MQSRKIEVIPTCATYRYTCSFEIAPAYLDHKANRAHHPYNDADEMQEVNRNVAGVDAHVSKNLVITVGDV